ncbi:MAG TPA: histidine triad nucleotide-binding protein, partial [bacterium]|nr:histidine triad nucleotide-binding protein [bacterium]
MGCLFCKIAGGEIPSEKVYEDDDVVAFRDISPQAPVHILIIPRAHISGVDAAGPDAEVLLGRLLRVGARLAEKEGVGQSGYRLVINACPDAGQA